MTAAPGAGGPARQVLVVDDSAVIRELIAVNLELEGFEVTTAEDGQSGLASARAIRPDVITLDVMMPRLNGFETAARLRADPATAHIPIVMVTARAQAKDLARGDNVGVDAYLTKPFEPADLVSIVSRLAESGRGGAAADTLDR
jgi:CheY-like chemotaxis protein